ncbi:MAG TPA: hypothetical protein VG675_13120 [Bryobacteraceae bacterium]|nr:hypothetical protein [Bryobacteraceae bacterium]
MVDGYVKESRERELQRILSSKVLEGAPTLRRLLEYLGNKALAGEADSLKEYSVGVDALNKLPNYDPRSDASVRVQVSKLREKLQVYYETEGRNNPLFVDIPKGHYKLEFQLRDAGGNPPRDPSADQQIRTWRRYALVLGTCLAASLLLTAAIIVKRSKPEAQPQNWSADLQTIWQPFLQGNRRVIMSLGTPMFLRFHDGQFFFRNTRLNDPAQLAGMDKSQVLPEFVPESYRTSFFYTGIGEAFAAVDVSRLLALRGVNVVLQPSNALSWEDVNGNDLIFIGAPKFNLQLLEARIKQDFVFDGSKINNTRPQRNEPATFVDSDSGRYGLVSRLPGFQGKGSIMVLAANSTEATRALAEYLCDPKDVAQLVRQLKGNGREIPRYFQAVIVGRFNSHVPIEIHYVTHHALALDQPPV